MFSAVIEKYDWREQEASIYAKTASQVRTALDSKYRTLEDFKALISPAAAPFLEEMAQQSMRLTTQRFGKTVQMYAPLYLSNECQNICTYCAFSLDNKIKRKTLTDSEIMLEGMYLKSQGYEHILLVTGEANQTVGVAYLVNAIKLLKPHFANISIEVQPLDTGDYKELKAAGLSTVLVYQETYHSQHYKQYHPKGKKANYTYRVNTPDRIGQAGVHKIGLGTLIGLEDWRTDCFFTALHLNYLERHYWQTKYSVSFPRLRPIEVQENGTEAHKDFDTYMTDRELVQLICAWRLFNQELEISLSTREEERFRDNIIPLGITSISAGSKTNPGGYVVAPQSLEQFEISDERTPAEIAYMIRRHGYEPVYKDWDDSFNL